MMFHEYYPGQLKAFRSNRLVSMASINDITSKFSRKLTKKETRVHELLQINLVYEILKTWFSLRKKVTSRRIIFGQNCRSSLR